MCIRDREEGRESGYAKGKQNGYAEAVCLMYESGLSIEQIAGIIKDVYKRQSSLFTTQHLFVTLKRLFVTVV